MLRKQAAREEKKVLADGAMQDREQYTSHSPSIEQHSGSITQHILCRYQSVIATLKKDREEDKVKLLPSKISECQSSQQPDPNCVHDDNQYALFA
jgi:hypothetical protein